MKRIVLTLIASVAVLCANAQIKGKVQEIDMEQFAEKIGFILEQDTSFHFKGNRPAVVDFNATWCGPCRKLAPILDELAKQFKGKVDFYSVDVDKNKPLAQALQVRSVPFLVFFPKKGTPKTLTGLYPKDGSMSDWITVFVEVPIETFNPVKTVNDLLRPEHQ